MKKIFKKSLFKFLFVIGIFFITANIVSAAVNTITVTPYQSIITIKNGDRAQIYFSTTGTVTRCYINGDTTNLVTSPFSVSPTATTTYTITCDDYVAAPACGSYTTSLPACFIADTKVLLSDGTSKNIQDVKIGDVLKGETSNNTVLGFHDPKLENKKLYSFNGGRYFVTAEHPFKTIDGWKSIDPSLTEKENIGITVTKLNVGDTLITENGKVLLKTIDSKAGKADTQLYNFLLNGDHTYYADQYLVHNKAACTTTSQCGSGYCLGGVCSVCYASEPGCISGYASSCEYQSSGLLNCTQTTCTGYCNGTVTSTGANCTPLYTTLNKCNSIAGCSWVTASTL